MTGHQGHPGTGLHADRSSGPALDIEQLCEGIGVPATTVDAFDEEAVKAAIKRALAGRELSVLVALAPCILMDRSPHERVVVDDDRCNLCGLCVELGCPAVVAGDEADRDHRATAPAAASASPSARAAPSACPSRPTPRARGVNGVATVSLAGVGGQGIILAAAIVAQAAMAAGFDVKASEVKGMAQRGGSVVSTVRYGKQVWSPVAPHADVVIATETLEGRRALEPAGRQGHAGLRHHGDRSRQRAARREGLPRRPGRGGSGALHPAHRRRRRGAGARGRHGARRQRRPAGRRHARAALRLSAPGSAPSSRRSRPRSSRSTGGRSPSAARRPQPTEEGP